MGDLSRALVQFEKAVESNPRSATAHYLLAKTYCLCDSSSLAIKEYSLLSQLDPKLAEDTLIRQKTAVFLGMEPYNSVRLTDAAGNDAFPAMSFDGRQIAFSSKRDGNPELYLMDSGGTNQKRLTANPAVDYGPSFSPDGGRLVFVSDRDGNDEIYLYDLASGRETRLTRDKGDDWLPRFSPDGQEIFWVSDRSGNYAIWRMPAEGGDRKPAQLFYQAAGGDIAYFDLSSAGLLAQKEVKNQGFAFSLDLSDIRPAEVDLPPFRTGIPTIRTPDGLAVAYVSSRDGNDEIYLYRADQRQPVRLTNNPAEDFVFGFSPDGRAMLYDSDRGGDRDVYLMQLDKLVTGEQLARAIAKL